MKPRKRLSAFDADIHHSASAPGIINLYMIFLTVCFFAAVPLAMLITGDKAVLPGFWRILTSPSRLVTDYFALGGLPATLLNTALCSLACNFLILITRTKPNATTLAGYMLVIAHGFYGLNFLNMWPPLLGVLLFCFARHKTFGGKLHIALFSTALGPFISDFVFRYALGERFTQGEPKATLFGILLAILFGLATGFVVPALLPGTTAMHRGFNMYKAGLAIGILGIFVYSFLYKTLGIEPPEELIHADTAYLSLPYAYRSFMNGFFLFLFAASFLWGFYANGFSLHGYRELLKSTGHGTDFLDRFGMPVCLINIGVYGLLILVYLNIVFVLPELFPFLPRGVGFTGATAGVTLAALTFAADGQQPRTVAPIALGYIFLQILVCMICGLCKMDIPWTLSSQSYINGLAFATGLCPFSGKYGWKVGLLAGLLSAIICTSTSAMHGGFVLYNGGFNAGLTALVLLPVLDYYKIKPKFDDPPLKGSAESAFASKKGGV